VRSRRDSHWSRTSQRVVHEGAGAVELGRRLGLEQPQQRPVVLDLLHEDRLGPRPGAPRRLEDGLDVQQLFEQRRVDVLPEARVVVDGLVRPAGVLHVEGQLVRLARRVGGDRREVDVARRRPLDPVQQLRRRAVLQSVQLARPRPEVASRHTPG